MCMQPRPGGAGSERVLGEGSLHAVSPLYKAAGLRPPGLHKGRGHVSDFCEKPRPGKGVVLLCIVGQEGTGSLGAVSGALFLPEAI